MEKDLRDAYAALKLLRADLVKTRRDNRALEASLTYLKSHGLPSSAAQTRESREMQQMQYEDAKSQLLRLAIQYENRFAELKKIKKDHNCMKKKKEDTPELDNNQVEEDEGLRKLALLNKLHSLTATVEQQTQTMLTQQATFLLQKEELETMLEETQQKLQVEQSKAADAVLEQQATKEKYEFLETQVDILKEEMKNLEKEKTQMEIKVAAHAQTNSILKQQLDEKEDELSKWKSDQKLQFDHKMNALITEGSARLRRENEVKQKEVHVEYQQEILKLQREYELMKVKLTKEKEKNCQEKDEMQKRFERTLDELERNRAAMETQIADSEEQRIADAEKHQEVQKEANERYATTIKSLEAKLEETQKQLAVSETNRFIERKEYEKSVAEAEQKLQDQQKDRDDQEMVLRNLEGDLAESRSQLAKCEALLAQEIKKHREQLDDVLQQLHDQQCDKERHAITLQDLESKLTEAQLRFDDSETKLLAQMNEHVESHTKASQIAAQHEKTSRALAFEKKALQQEICDGRHALNAMTEEFLHYRSLAEEKSREQAGVQAQCESLETQLLSAEDHRDHTYASLSINDLSTLMGFHDDEIGSMPPSKSWALLRAGIKELDGFLPHFQTVLGAIHDALRLCETHADTLPALCERLEEKVLSEKEQMPIIVIALRLLRFAAVSKAHFEQEETSVTATIVQSFRKRVLDALTQWHECDADDNEEGNNESIPTPSFTITSRETALILQNWTNDRSKQIGVRRWLARMEAYPGVPPLRGASSNRVLEIPPEGCTLELEDMTPQVKDAFLLLLIPILRQNRALHVRVFTRYKETLKPMMKQQQVDEEEDSEKVWSMRVHVQSAVSRCWPTPLKLSPNTSGLPSPLAPTSPASSVSSSTSAGSRLQIIQERLQYLHNHV